MSAPSLDRESPVSATAVIVMPRGMSAPSAVRKLAVGGLIDAALVDCSAMGESSRPSLSMAQELIAQLVDARGARWVQLIEPPRSWLVCVRAQMRWRGMGAALSVVPSAFSGL